MEQVIQKLKDAEVGTVKIGEPLSQHTTWKIGGPADVLIEPGSVEGLIKAMAIINEEQVPFRAIGRGSNLLVSDEGIEGVVIKLGRGLDHLEINDDEIMVGGGYPLIKLVTVISRQGLSGADISKILKKTRVLFPDGRLEWIDADDMEFAYRTSRLQREEGICVEAVFKLQKGEKEDIVKHMQKNKDYRRETQPWSHPTCGSVFRNPLPNHAGALIEEAGLKGYQIGGAQISEMHANFIVNIEDAKAEDVLNLIKHAKETIKKSKGIDMETEVEMIGRKLKTP
jgi:UDP-N-acetylmuramate dehydrogenase